MSGPGFYEHLQRLTMSSADSYASQLEASMDAMRDAAKKREETGPNGAYGHVGAVGKEVRTKLLIEAEDKIRSGLLQFLQLLDGTTAESLEHTPQRFINALHEMTRGYTLSPREILKVFEEKGCDELVILRDIPFTSLCEHHLLPFSGTVDIGYLPSMIEPPKDVSWLGPYISPQPYRIVGLSKLARIVDCFAQRIQVQERITRQIAEALMDEPLKAYGAGVIVKGYHSCVQCRGVKKETGPMITSSMLGVFRNDQKLRSEFLTLTQKD